ncbi:MAG: hypothetical protein KGZ81_13855 [Flavobacteriales bacterium]|nr:hypothetical protein [Flavobacteriales bacterium]
MKPTPKISLLLDSARGQYIPRDFVLDFDLSKFQGLSQSDIYDCQDPDNEWYWGAWQNILDTAQYIEDGRVFTLHQDGDLWLICLDELTQEEKQNFGFED